jgi:hypothetical protein
MSAKSKNPEYHQLSVYVPKNLALKFKAKCTEKGLELSSKVTEFIEEWLKQEENI